MSDFDYAFGQYVSPRQEVYVDHGPNFPVQSPSYSTQTDFSFDLRPLTGSPTSRFSLNNIVGDKKHNTLQHLQQHTTLDFGQATALLSSLGREFSFTQGPPGCGKTFLGVELVRVLLASRPAALQKPILLVCRTNHALDSFMTGLRDAGVDKLMRVGSGSKAEWTESINLRAVGRDHNYSGRENGQRYHINEERGTNWEILDAWCRDLSKEVVTGLPCWQHIHPIARTHYPKAYAQLATCTTNPSAKTFTYEYWAKGGDLTAIQSLHQALVTRLNAGVREERRSVVSQDAAKTLLGEILTTANLQSIDAGDDDIWQSSLEQRKSMIEKWQAKIDKSNTALELLRVHQRHKHFTTMAKSIRDEKDIRAISRQNVVGMTTTVCAGRWDLLCKVGFEIMVCEEAAEVLEAHSLCSLLPTLKHAIQIGDPLQLRPSVEEQVLAMGTLRGQLYRLDESLFERIMKPIDPLAKTIPTTALLLQRRMHPIIARLSRVFYPFLEDHESTYSNPFPKGLQSRLWWLDHIIPEDDPASVSKSITHEYEVKMVKELVTYLLRGYKYRYADIAILRPYSGQLLKLRQALSIEFPVWLGEQDKNALVEAGAIDPDSDELNEPQKLNIPMNDFVRLATIDNFQGEEAKVIILSMVRSGRKLGFIRSTNRMNVACSRVRDGFYVIGNSQSLEADPTWRSIIDVFRAENCIGDHIRLQCDRHLEHHKLVRSADDISTFTTCAVPCEQELPCGHVCAELCHDPTLHGIIPCTEPCRKRLQCEHECRSRCNQDCGPCEEIVTRYLESCEHTIPVPCSQKVVVCDRFAGFHYWHCGRHAAAFTCGEPEKFTSCNSKCDEELPCGHSCNAKCGTCHMEGKHPKCQQACHKQLLCGHICTSSCHEDSECPQCTPLAHASCCHEETGRVCCDKPKPCRALVSALDPDQHIFKTLCCFTNGATTHDQVLHLLTPDKTEPLVQDIISVLINRHDTLSQQIKHHTEILTRTNQLFILHQMQATALAGPQNIDSILRRTNTLTKIQSEIGSEKDVLATVDHSLHVLATRYPGQTTTGLNGLMPSTLHDLEIRTILARARDTFATITFMIMSKDQSMQMQRSAWELALFTKTELVQVVDEVREDILVEDLVLECQRLITEIEEVLSTSSR